ncbi:uncharacterized protein EI90DRAFT_1604126 [Cantharellus anzutake]|uniref:uncharacterized protein n=1 Tax=Cantharellus anzutake TaxID=1750568 RepID=UPI00190724BC|nr:uncharacterized protein EI90DRAFT_1604126 [Cantharellus anzutake]KAF8328128.1 hypothetical protein EI90DRAFT_1604126 [Cantharellus anzutake]
MSSETSSMRGEKPGGMTALILRRPSTQNAHSWLLRKWIWEVEGTPNFLPPTRTCRLSVICFSKRGSPLPTIITFRLDPAYQLGVQIMRTPHQTKMDAELIDNIERDYDFCPSYFLCIVIFIGLSVLGAHLVHCVNIGERHTSLPHKFYNKISYLKGNPNPVAYGAPPNKASGFQIKTWIPKKGHVFFDFTTRLAICMI